MTPLGRIEGGCRAHVARTAGPMIDSHGNARSTIRRPNASAIRWMTGTSIRSLFAFVLALITGCTGVTQNPSRIGNLPNGNIIQTHARPPLHGYWSDFDRHAKSLTVTPRSAINQVGTHHVIVASVCDDKGNGRRSRRVEWHVSGVGYIVEVDESGLFPGRGYLVDQNYAVSYTNYRNHTITRGSKDKRDDIPLRPGQTYCVIFSPEEGETHVTCYAPGINDWEKHKVTVTKHWVDAQPIFPPPAINRAGEPHTLTTRVVRTTDGSGHNGYRVRYRVIDGPPAVFAHVNTPAVEVVTDGAGQGSAILQQVQAIPGTNRIQIDVVRPSDSPTGRELLISSHITTKTWVAPQISMQKMAPPAVAVGSQIPYKIIVTNTGSVATSGLTIRDTIPPSLTLLGSNPPASIQGSNLLWNFGPLQPNQSVAVDFACQATQAGDVNNCAEAATPDGLRQESCSQTKVVAGNLVVTKTGPPTAFVGQPVTFQISVTNNGQAPVLNARLVDLFDQGFVSEQGPSPLTLPVGTIAPGETKVVPITLAAQAQGALVNQVTAEGDGVPAAVAQHRVEVVQPQVNIIKTGPKAAIVGANVDFTIAVKNTGNVPVQNVVVQDLLPRELQPVAVNGPGAVQGQSAIFNLGAMGPGEEKAVSLTARALAAGTNICNGATVTALGVPTQQSNATCLDIRGVPGLLTELIDRADPVPVGADTVYTIRLTNQGSEPLTNLVVACSIPPEFEYVDSEGHPSTLPAEARNTGDGRFVIFKPFNGANGEPGMLPGKQVFYQIRVKSTRPGDARFAIEVRSDQIKKPIVDEESTQVFDPATGATTSQLLQKREETILPASIPIPEEIESKEPVTTPAGGSAEKKEDAASLPVSLSVPEPKIDLPPDLIVPKEETPANASGELMSKEGPVPSEVRPKEETPST